MKTSFTKTFWKQYYALPKREQQQFEERHRLFLSDPTHPLLRVHPLRGRFAGYWSMNVTGDIRALYHFDKERATITFSLIGTHSQLYG